MDLNRIIQLLQNYSKQSLDQGLDLQKAFNTVDHDTLLRKLEQYGVRGITNKWLETYLKDRQQFVSINDYNSEGVSMPIGVPQGSVLGSLLLLLYINDLNLAIKHCKIHHFPDHTNLLYTNSSIKKINKWLNKDLNNLTNWLKANKISSTVDKMEK